MTAVLFYIFLLRVPIIADDIVINIMLLYGVLKKIGVFFWFSGCTFKCDPHCAKRKYFRTLNIIFGKIDTSAPIGTTLSLVESFSMLYYCTALTVDV